jgi:voltage-gated potassium channel
MNKKAVSIPVKPERISNFELFILLLTMLSMVNLIVFLLPLPAEIKQVFAVMSNVYCLFFLFDFFIRLKKSVPKSDYFLKKLGFLDLLGSIPFAPFAIFRLYRVIKYVHILKVYTIRRLLNDINERRAESALFLVFFVLMVVLQFGGSTILWAESYAANRNIVNASDALWWGVVTVTTVGYGDRFPVTNIGRLVGVVMMFVGVGTFGVLTSYLANSLLAPPKRG